MNLRAAFYLAPIHYLQYQFVNNVFALLLLFSVFVNAARGGNIAQRVDDSSLQSTSNSVSNKIKRSFLEPLVHF